MSVNEKMTAIADAIRDKTGETEPLSLDEIAEKIPNVYKAGQDSQADIIHELEKENAIIQSNMNTLIKQNNVYHNEERETITEIQKIGVEVENVETASGLHPNISDAIPDVYDAGKKSQYDEFWDNFQNYGKRTNYDSAFRGEGWNDNTFYPKYDINLSNNVFFETRITDLKQKLIDCKVKLLPVENAGVLFRDSRVTHIPDISSVALTIPTYICYSCQFLKSIDGVCFSDSITKYNRPFELCYELENITFYNTTLLYSISFAASSKLTTDSMKNIISCLKNYKGTANANTNTIAFHQTAWQRLEADSSSPIGGTWKDYVYYELGWNYQ